MRRAWLLRLLGAFAALLAAAAQAPVGCGVPTRLSFAELRNEYKNQNFFPVGKTAEYTCRPGYRRHPRIPLSITCLKNGRWSEASEFCKKKSCGHPGEPENGKVIVTDIFFGSTVYFACEEGHRLIGQSYRRCEISGARVDWSGNVPICQRIPCLPPPDIANGRHNGVLMEDFSYGSAVTYKCDNGLQLTGEASIHCTTKDGVNGEWSERPPRCGDVRCPVPQIRNGRRVSGDSRVYSYKDNVTFECDPGFTMKGHSLSQCQTDETWDPPVPVCEQVQRCPSPPTIDHGKPSVQAWDVFTSGMSVNYHCDPGYSFLGEASLHCTASGAWSRPLPQCEAKCISPVVENGRTNGVQLAYRPRDIVLFECDPGYALSGSPETRCQDDGSWDPPIPVCERRLRCPSPPSIDHGKPSGLALAVFTNGMSVNYSCEPGYSLTGQASIYCTASGTWSPLPPRCEVSEVFCITPEIPNGRKVAGHRPVYRPRDTVTFKCDPGYTLNDSRPIQCREDTTWDPPVPVCLQDKCVSVTKRDLKREQENVQTHLLMQQNSLAGIDPPVTHRAKVAAGTSSSVYFSGTARAIGSGERGFQSAAGQDGCGVPMRLSFAELKSEYKNQSYFPVGKTIHYTCRPGYMKHPKIKATVMCFENGSWSEALEFCKKKSCGHPGEPENGRLLVTDTLFGSTVNYTCEDGHRLIGQSHRRCEISGARVDWSGDVPICQRIPCLPPPDIANGRHTGVLMEDFSYGSAVTYKCDNGLQLTGEASIHCTTKDGVNGEWSERPPRCGDVRCPVPQIRNGRRVSGDSRVYSYKDNVTFECDPGFTMKGHSLSQCQTDETWDPPVPVCEQVQRCPSPPTIDHGKPSVQAWDVFTSGMSVNYHCDPGYSFLGEASLHCTASGAWSRPLPQCEAKCISPVVENGRTNGVQLAYRPRDIVLFECDPGYALSGSPETRCQDDGSWDPPIPVCERRLRCPSPPSIDHGKPSGLALAVFTNGMSVNYSCEPGYSLTGQASIYCTASGTWSPLPPRCEVSEVFCITPEIPNGRKVAGHRPVYRPRDKVTFKCDPGYTLNDSRPIQCREDTTWDPPVPVCLQDKYGCGVPMRLSFAELESEYKNQSYFPVGKTIHYTCRPGYMKHPKIKATVMCFENGSWSEALEFCKKKSCGHPGEPENGRLLVTDTLFGSTVNYTCEDGHRLIGQSHRRCEISGARVDWSGDVPICRRIPCLPPPDIANGRHTGVLMEDFSYGSAVIYSCDNGLQLTGEASIHCTTKDGVNGEWSERPPRCGDVRCPVPQIRNGRRVSGDSRVYSYKDNVTFECDPGFTMKGHSLSQCQTDETWDPPVPVCEQVQRCPSPPTIDHGKPSVQAWDVFTSGMSVNYHCDPGYSFLGEASLHCTASGAWSRPLPQCEAKCISPVVENGRTNGVQLAYRPRDIVLFECDPGYALSGSPETRCQDDGSWDPPIPVCERRLRCPSPPSIDHGKPSGLALAVFTNGMSVNYSCEPGYSLTGQASIYCTASGTWSPLPPRCEVSEVFCITPEIPNGRKVAGHRPVYRPRDKVTFKCDPGYTLNDSRPIQCREDTTWDPPVPVCLQDKYGCGVPMRLSFAELESEYKNQSYFPVGKTIHYTCRPGYMKHPKIKATVMCFENGSWSEALEFCKKKSCGHPGEPENGRLLVTDTLFGSTVNYTCEDGHRLIGQSHRRCEISGARVDWSGDVPICQRIPCLPPPDIANGRHTGVLMEDFSYGSAVIYSCDNGLQLTGEASIHCTTKDGVNGEWSERPPRCGASRLKDAGACSETKKGSECDGPTSVLKHLGPDCADCSAPSVSDVRCPVPQIRNGRRVSGDSRVYSYKDNVTFECDPGFTMKGHSLSQCQTDETWDPPVPVCEQVQRCPSPPTIDHGKPSVQAWDVFTSGMSVNYHCDPGYSFLGEASLHCTASGAWSRPLPQCEAKCISPVVENGRTNGVQLAYRPRDIVLFECDPGYALSGSPETRCQDDGSWDPPIPVCERRLRCPSPPSIDHGKPSGLALAVFTNGMSVNYSCEPGYSLTGQASIYCTASGTWSPLPPRCEVSEVFCITPEIPNGRKVAGHRPVYRPRDTVTFKCDPGYTLNDSRPIQCREDTTWDPPVPVCLQDKCVSVTKRDLKREQENVQTHLLMQQNSLAGIDPPVTHRAKVAAGTSSSVYFSGTARAIGSGERGFQSAAGQDGCGVPMRLSFAELKSEYKNQSYFPVGKTIHYTCRPGYMKHPKIKATVMCFENGSWSEALEFCKKKSCGHPGEPENGRLLVTDTLFGSTVNYTCEDGHRLIGQSHRRCEISGARVDWSGDVPICQRIPCLPPPDIANGRHTGVLMEDFSYGSAVTYKCDNGLQLTGEASIHCTTKDGVNGEWSERPPRCGDVRCPVPQIRNGRRVSGDSRVYSYKDNVTFECDPGFTMKGHSLSQCQTDETWDPPVPVCEQVQRCPSPPTIDHGKPSVQAWDVFTSGMSVNYHCDPGYSFLGEASLHCTASGAWSRPLPQCEAKCISPVVENGRTNGVQLAYRPRDIVLFECDPGYALSGSPETRCQDDGSWDPPIPVCERRLRCPSPPSIDHGKPSGLALAVFTNGMSVNYSCEPGYSLTGQASIYCTASGTWSPLPPRCEVSEVFCITPEIPNGRKVAGHRPVYRPRDKVTFKCDPGYTLNDSRPIQCREDTTWDPPVPVCLQDKYGCGVPMRLSFAELESEYKNQSYFPVGKTIHYTCRPGYMKHPKIKATVMCFENGSWSEALEFCKKKSCGHPGEPENGRLLVTDTLFGSTVNYTCEDGHRLIGQSHRRCEISGARVDWSGDVPICQHVRCPVPQIRNGRRVSGDSRVYSYKDHVTFECDPGFTMKGHSLSQCQTDETWHPPVPVCEQVSEVFCITPEIPNGRKVAGHRPVYRPRDTVTFKCDPGYTLNDSRPIQCREDTTWDPPVPVCLQDKSKCVSPVVENGRTNGVQLAYSPRDIVLFECNPGYALSGSPETQCQDDGRWDPPIPVCERRLRCRSPPSIDHGKPSGLALAVFTSGMSVNYSCEPGYSLSGQASIYCTASGTWSPLPPRCEVLQCAPPPAITNGKPSGQDLEFFTIGTSLNYSCELGYSVTGKTSVYCTASGTWSFPLPQCEEIKCAFPEVQGGRKAVVGTTYRFGTNVTLECDNGYVLEGSSLIQCQHDFTWDPPVPVCKPTSLASYNFVSEVPGIIGGVLLLLLVITIIWKIMSKQNAGYYDTHENTKNHVPLTHLIEQKSSFAPNQEGNHFS